VLDPHVRSVRHAEAERDVELAGRDLVYQRAGRCLARLDAGARAPRMERLNERLGTIMDPGREPDAQHACVCVAVVIGDADEPIGRLDRGASRGQRGPSGGGQRDVSCRAVEQPHSQLPLQPAHRRAHRLLGHLKTLRGAREAEFLGDRDEDPQLLHARRTHTTKV
jgi:hypothetical protein